MPQLGAEVVKARAARLRKAAAARCGRWLDSLVGTTQPVLIEGPGAGHTDAFAPVSLPGAGRGQAGRARITGREGSKLTAAWA